MNNKKLLPLFIFISVAVGFMLGRYVYYSKNIFFKYNSEYRKLEKIINLIESNYKDKINTFDFINESLLKKISEIDPYSKYINEDNKKAYELKDTYFGFGIQYSMFADTVIIVDIFDGSSAAKNNLNLLDKIISVNDISIVNLTIDSIAKIFDTNDKLTIKAVDFFTNKDKTILLEKSEILVPTVSHLMLNNDIGYIKIDKFMEKTHSMFKDAAKSILANGGKSLILDLRNNPGGILKSSIEITKEFFSSEDTLVVIQTNNNKKEVINLKTDGLLAEFEVIVLINNGTASASEQLCLTLQDYDRALIIGTPSYGKGVFQQEINIVENDFLKITTGKYFGPSGRWIHRNDDPKKHYKTKNGRIVKSNSGITPEIVVFSEGLGFMDFEYYAPVIVSQNRNLFTKNPDNYETVINNIVDTIQFTFEADKINLTNSLRKFFVNKKDFLKIRTNDDMLVQFAIDIFNEKSVEENIFAKDSL